ncbi:MAG: hypothetical protein U1E54_01270 [Candidatus Levybacteria bacterium]|nr:hypothetical protein [Candidatus Levybacteria bacterium]
MSTSIKVMSIIGIVLAVISFICLVAFDNRYDYESAVGWGVIAAIYLLAFSIVALVKNSTKVEKK